MEEALGALPALAEKFEIIAVDDGSRDRTPAIADELAQRHPGRRSGSSTTPPTSATAPPFGPDSGPLAST